MADKSTRSGTGYAFDTGQALGPGSDPTFNTLTTTGGRYVDVTTITNADTPYTVVATDNYIVVDATGGVVQVDLPAATGSGRVLFIKKISSNNNGVTIDADGAETIDGNLTYLLQMPAQVVSLVDIAATAWGLF